jgi:acetate kinase
MTIAPSAQLLVLNLGSSSLKAVAYAASKVPSELARVAVERHANDDGAAPGSQRLLDALVRCVPTLGEAPLAIAHRIVHGGDFPDAVELSATNLAVLAGLSALAPLHQPPALALVEATRDRWPQARQIGMFDTCFHQTLAPAQRRFALPRALFDAGIKRYGFHGLAFASALRQLAALAPDVAGGRVLLAHLGGGSSICAALGGRSVATSMGMTPLAGVPMSTRSGSLDPGVLLYLQRRLQYAPAQVDALLWREAGMRGLSGQTGDMRELLASDSEGARLAVEIYVDAVAAAIAAHAVSVGGIDALVFSGGIGRHAWSVRERICAALSWAGVELDAAANRAGSTQIATPEATIRCFAVDVDEEREVVEAALRVLAN